MKEVLLKLEGVLDEVGECPRYLLDMKRDIQNHLLRIELGENLGVDLPSHFSLWGGCCSINEWMKIVKFEEGSGRVISWSDDGKQPEDGWYLLLTFPTGAYIFDSRYPEDSFNNFFSELKSFGADYCDTVNHNLYFNLDNNPIPARQVYKCFNDIYKKWYDIAREEVLEKEILKAQENLETLLRERG